MNQGNNNRDPRENPRENPRGVRRDEPTRPQRQEQRQEQRPPQGQVQRQPSRQPTTSRRPDMQRPHEPYNPPVAKVKKGTNWWLVLGCIVLGCVVGLLIRALAEPDAPGWALPVVLVAGVIIVGAVWYSKRKRRSG